MLTKSSLASALARIPEPWSPHLLAQVNDTHVRLAKLQGAFIWHAHEHEDELFLVVKGRLHMLVRDPDEREIILDEGECILIPRGTQHCPNAPEECHVLLVEPASTLNTGNVRNERTRDDIPNL